MSLEQNLMEAIFQSTLFDRVYVGKLVFHVLKNGKFYQRNRSALTKAFAKVVATF